MAAGPGCALANGVLNAFETTKVKLQLQDSTRPVYRCSTMMGVMQQVVREEGLVSFLLNMSKEGGSDDLDFRLMCSSIF